MYVNQSLTLDADEPHSHPMLQVFTLLPSSTSLAPIAVQPLYYLVQGVQT